MNALQIENAIAAKKYVRLTREKGNFSEYANGCVLERSSNFLLIISTHDFAFVGYEIIPLDTISKWRCNKDDRFYDKVITAEGIKGSVGPTPDIDLSNWKTIFRALKKAGVPVIVLSEEPHLDYFNIGTIHRVTDTYVSIFYITPAGRVESEATKAKFDHITKVSFGDRYSTLISKHARPEKR